MEVLKNMINRSQYGNYIYKKQFHIWCIYIDIFGKYGEYHKLTSIKDYYTEPLLSDDPLAEETRGFIVKYKTF